MGKITIKIPNISKIFDRRKIVGPDPEKIKELENKTIPYVSIALDKEINKLNANRHARMQETLDRLARQEEKTPI